MERFSRKVYLKSVIRDEYTTTFSDRVIFLSNFIRNIIFRAQIFVNSYICDNYESSGDLKAITQQNFWYSICQLIMGARVTNKNFMSNSIVLAFDDFKQKHPNIVYQPEQGTSTKGYSDPLSAACVTLSTSYLNHIVENFDKRLLYYLYIKIKAIYEVSLALYVDLSNGKLFF